MIFGNGGSAAIASHFSVDLTKNAGIRCFNFNESDLITCFSNDYGYEKWVEKAVSFYEKVIRINPNHTNAQYNLGVAFYNLKELKKAIYLKFQRLQKLIGAK